MNTLGLTSLILCLCVYHNGAVDEQREPWITCDLFPGENARIPAQNARDCDNMQHDVGWPHHNFEKVVKVAQLWLLEDISHFLREIHASMRTHITEVRAERSIAMMLLAEEIAALVKKEDSGQAHTPQEPGLGEHA
jgi:hypothetical protein